MAFCRNCGTQIDDNIAFCPVCGVSTYNAGLGAGQTAAAIFSSIKDKTVKGFNTVKTKVDASVRNAQATYAQKQAYQQAQQQQMYNQYNQQYYGQQGYQDPYLNMMGSSPDDQQFANDPYLDMIQAGSAPENPEPVADASSDSAQLFADNGLSDAEKQNYINKVNSLNPDQVRAMEEKLKNDDSPKAQFIRELCKEKENTPADTDKDDDIFNF